MTGSLINSGILLLVTFGSPMDDIVAILMFAMPLVVLGIILLIYQRHLPREDLKRNVMVIFGLLCILATFLGVLFAASDALPWDFGSWNTFAYGLQLLTDFVFGSVVSSLLYFTALCVIFAVLAHYIIATPDPDFTGLREELKQARDEVKVARESIQKLEVDNKRLNEFLTEREETLTTLEGELETIKTEVGAREDSITMMEEQLKAKDVPSTIESELRAQLKQRDVTIESLQSEIDDLRLVIEGTGVAETPKLDDSKLKELQKEIHENQARWVDLVRRAETASEVSDSVISDLVELISQVQASGKDESAKQAIVSLIEGLGRSMTRVARESGDVRADEPKVEMIGAIIMVNEIVDAIKKMIRK